MTAPTDRLPGVAELVERALAGDLGPDPADLRTSVAFTTRQGARHVSRATAYRNTVVSVRVGDAVGSCAAEPDDVDDSTVTDCAGATVADLLAHPDPVIRTAALDAYLMSAHPHETSGARPVVIGPGDSLAKSMARASAVVDLLDAVPGQRVLVVGVVNSLLHHLRERGLEYVPCDLKGGRTEWEEPIVTDAESAVGDCDVVLASGMTVGNGSFEPLLRTAVEADRPLVVFAQTASAIVPRFLGSGVTAVSAEPYPFFWLHGGPSTLHHYRAGTPRPERAR
ncbi:Rossmann-like domain-containing protein [Saccharothrix hoggarensis]|uniref:Rossmann-like domain-containing protein n=1 Tax=Saccharothrix hoggarensis TaxID=913853 RepID=A0ABW3R1G4_9PSEU